MKTCKYPFEIRYSNIHYNKDCGSKHLLHLLHDNKLRESDIHLARTKQSIYLAPRVTLITTTNGMTSSCTFSSTRQDSARDVLISTLCFWLHTSNEARTYLVNTVVARLEAKPLLTSFRSSSSSLSDLTV